MNKKGSHACGRQSYPLKLKYNMAWDNLRYVKAIHITVQHFFIDACDSNQHTPTSIT